MTKAAQNLILITTGAAVLWVTVATDEYLNYVKSGFRPILIAAAVAVVVLGAAGLRSEWRADPPDGGRGHDGEQAPCDTTAPDPASGHDDHDHEHRQGHGGGRRHGHEHGQGHGHGHEHGRGPRVAWLLFLPVMAIFLIAPPALGSFTANRDGRSAARQVAAPVEGFGALRPATGGSPIKMTLSEYIGRSFEAQTGDPSRLTGYPIMLTGFVVPRKAGGWQLTRLKMSCCAGDAIPMTVIIKGERRPPADSWVRVTGTWVAPGPEGARTGVHALAATDVTPVKKPKHPYE